MMYDEALCFTVSCRQRRESCCWMREAVNVTFRPLGPAEQNPAALFVKRRVFYLKPPAK